MPSTYTTNLGIELPADGELDGVWGDVVNENMDILDRAINGSIALSLSGTTSTLTTSDGALSDGQYKLLVLGGSPSGTHTITIAPSDAQKIYFVRNTTAQSVVFTQGSGGNVTVATGDSAIIYSDGAGAGAAVVNITNDFAMSSVKITGGTIDGTVIGGTSAAAGTFTTVTGTSFVSSGDMTFGDNDKAIFGAGSDLQIYHDGTNSYIDDQGSGRIIIKGNDDVRIRSGADEEMIVASSNGAVTLYHDSFPKLATTATGVDVTGTVTADGLTVDGAGEFVGTSGVQLKRNTTPPGAGTGANALNWQMVSTGSTYVTGASIQGISDGAWSSTSAPMYLSLRTVESATTTLKERVRIANNGDISFYEDTGTTPKFFWDASAEVLTVDNRTKVGTTADGVSIGSGTGTGEVLGVDTAGNGWNPLDIRAGSATQLYLNTNGNVGIGTTSPSDNLTVVPSANNKGITIDYSAGSARLTLTGNAASAQAITFGDSSSATSGQLIYDNSVDAMRINTNGSERMRIDSSGNVSIGSSSTPTKLFIQGTASATGGIRLQNSGGNPYSIWTDANSLYVSRGDGATTALAVTFGGNVGIGTSSPSFLLHVSSASAAAAQIEGGTRADLFLVDSGAATDLKRRVLRNIDNNLAFGREDDARLNFFQDMTITSAGNVGIGTTAPAAKLEVALGANGEYMRVGGDDATNNRALRFTSSTTGGSVGALHTINASSSSGVIALATNSTERLRITSAGNLLLGTTTDFTSTTTAGGMALTGYGVYPYTTQTGATNSSSLSSLTALPAVAATGSAGITLAGGQFSPAMSNGGTGGSSAATLVGVNSIPVITSSGSTALVSLTAVQGTANRGNASDTSANASNSITAGSFIATHGVSLPTTAVSGTVYGLSGAITNASGTMTAASAVRAGIFLGSTSTFNTNSTPTAAGFELSSFAVGAATAVGNATVTNGYGIKLAGPTVLATGTMTNYYAFRADSPTVTGGTLTNRYGIWINDPLSTNYFAGNVGIGTSSPAAKLDVTGEISSTGRHLTAQGVATSGYQFVGDGDSGMYQEASNQLQFSTANAERMRIDSSGNVGIGTTSPASRLNVVGGQILISASSGTSGLGLQISPLITALPAAQVQGYIGTGDSTVGTAGDLLIAPRTNTTASVRFITGTTPTERMRIDASGNVYFGNGVNVASPANSGLFATNGSGTDIAGASMTIQAGRGTGAGAGGSLIFNTAAAGTTGTTLNAATERMRISSGGVVSIGTTNGTPASSNVVGVAASVAGYISASRDNTSAEFNRIASDGEVVAFLRAGTKVGSISVTTTATAYNTSSDYRLKESIQPIFGASDRVRQLNPVNFAWKADGTRTDGFIAHEVQAVAPQAVTGVKDGEEMQAIDHSKLVPLLTAALQEALTEIALLKARLDAANI